MHARSRRIAKTRQCAACYSCCCRPRSLSSGAGYEIKGDALEAICAYRAAVTMDTSVTGQALPPEVLPPARVSACTHIVQSKHTPDPCKRTRAARTHTQARQQAQERLRVLVKKAGLMDTWTRLERKAAEVTPRRLS